MVIIKNSDRSASFEVDKSAPAGGFLKDQAGLKAAVQQLAAGSGYFPVIGLLVFACLVGCKPAGPRSLLEGKRLIESRQYASAMQELKNATALLPTNAHAWNYLGLAAHYAGQAAEAEKAYGRALYLDHNLVEARYNLGCLLLEQKRANLARNELTAFTMRRPNSTDAMVKLGLAQLLCRELPAAERTFSDVLRSTPQSAGALNGLGLVKVTRNRHAEAAQLFSNALKLQPGFRPALLNLAIVSQQYLKDSRGALQRYREYAALKPPPENVDAVKRVIADLEQTSSPAPRPPPTNPAPPIATNVVPAKPAVTNAPRAQALPKQEPPTNVAVLVTQPSNPPVELVRVPAEPILREARDVSLARPGNDAPVPAPQPPTETSARPAVATTPATTKSGFFEQVNPLRLFRSDQKTTRTTPLPDRAPESPQSEKDKSVTRFAYANPPKPVPGNRTEAEQLFARGVREQQADRLQAALKAYQAAAMQDPSCFEAQYKLGVTAFETGDLPLALSAYEKALAIKPESLDARYNLALALKQSNYHLDAVSELETVLKLSPNETRAHLALGNLYAQQFGDGTKARWHYMKVLESDPRHSQAGAIRFWLAANPQ